MSKSPGQSLGASLLWLLPFPRVPDTPASNTNTTLPPVLHPKDCPAKARPYLAVCLQLTMCPCASPSPSLDSVSLSVQWGCWVGWPWRSFADPDIWMCQHPRVTPISLGWCLLDARLAGAEGPKLSTALVFHWAQWGCTWEVIGYDSRSGCYFSAEVKTPPVDLAPWVSGDSLRTIGGFTQMHTQLFVSCPPIEAPLPGEMRKMGVSMKGGPLGVWPKSLWSVVPWPFTG